MIYITYNYSSMLFFFSFHVFWYIPGRKIVISVISYKYLSDFLGKGFGDCHVNWNIIQICNSFVIQLRL